MRKTKMQKGITLIALIITIIILLILAVVTIGSIKDSDIITYAQNASKDYNDKKEEEESIIAGYESLIESNLPEESKIGKAIVGIKVTKNSTINGEKYSSTNPVIPSGFAPINITGEHGSSWDAQEAPEVSKGLVITDNPTIRDENGNSVGNEFVWIPVPNISKFARKYDEINYRGVLYHFSGIQATEYDFTQTGGTREPANLSTSRDNTSNMSIWTETLYQESFNNMVASVSKYGGFYVGRYEISYNGSVVQSKAGEIPVNNMNWYSMYEHSLEYSTINASLGVTSEMIWGCQWDAMINFILTGTKPSYITETTNVGHGKSFFTSIPYETGGTNYSEVYTGEVKYNDIANNIYDLEGNVSEWTQEAISETLRGFHGGEYVNSHYYPAYRSNYNPTLTINTRGSRLSLYVKI